MSYIGSAMSAMECADSATFLRALKRLLVRLLALQEALSGQIIKDEVLRRQFAAAVLRLYENEEALLVSLLHNAVSQALRIPESESLVLREGSLMVDFLSEYAKQATAPQVARIVPLVQRMTKENVPMEVDPLRMGLTPAGPEQGTTEVPPALVQARDNLSHTASAFLSAIISCVDACPRAFKKVIRIVYESSESRFPGSGLRTLGGMIFLRLFCPAIVAPEAHNLASAPVPASVRRSLILVAKLLQSLVNGGQFEKEDYMIPFNSWIEENVITINNAFMKWVREGGKQAESNESGSEDKQEDWRSSSSSEGSSLDQFCTEPFSVDEADASIIRQGLKESMIVLRAHNGEATVMKAIKSLDMRYKDVKHALKLLSSLEQSPEPPAMLASSGNKLAVKERKGSFLGRIGRSRSGDRDQSLDIYQVDVAQWKKKHSVLWLMTLELDEDAEKEYKAAFKKHKVTGLKLQQITRESLVDYGIKRLGDRKKIYNQAQHLFHARLSAFMNKEVKHWSAEDIAIWLGANEMCEYQDQWLKEGISGQVLLDTLEDDNTLQTLNVNKCGHRKRIVRLLRPTCSSVPSTPSPSGLSSSATCPTRTRGTTLPHYASSRSLI